MGSFRQTKDIDGYEYEYEYENRIVKITQDSNDIAEFAYDALGRRIRKVDSVAGETTLYYYNASQAGHNMKRTQLVLDFILVSLILSLGIGWQEQSAAAQGVTNAAVSTAKANQSSDPSGILPKRQPDANNLLPRISFEKTVCDLGDVGQGTKNTCEFKFTNTGQALLKIGKINQICG